MCEDASMRGMGFKSNTHTRSAHELAGELREGLDLPEERLLRRDHGEEEEESEKWERD